MATPTSSPQRYLELLQFVEITNICILAVKASRKPDFKAPSRGTLTLKTKPQLENLTPNSLDALVEARVEGRSEGSRDSEFTCELNIRVSYSFTSQVPGITDDNELVDRFVATNVPINVWPYLREYISWLSTNMGIGTTLIPLLKTRPEPEKEP